MIPQSRVLSPNGRGGWTPLRPLRGLQETRVATREDRGNAFNFSPLRIMFAVGLSYIAFIMLRYVPSIPALWRVFIINGPWRRTRGSLRSSSCLGRKPPTRDCSPGHAGKEGPQLARTGASHRFSRAVALVWGFSRSKTGSSVSLSCGARGAQAR